MKKIFLTICFCFQLINLYAQEVPKLDDFGRIALNPHVSEQAKLPKEAKAQLETKLMQIATNYGMVSSVVNPRFIITANISITTKDIVPGPPQQIAQNMDITLFIGDAIENKIFSNIVISSSGVGTNENKAFIDAIKQLNTKNKKIELFIEEAKTKIIAYYNSQCDFINQEAIAQKNQEKYAESIYTLAQIPEVCQNCFFNALKEMAVIYDLKINNEANALLKNAQSTWAANPNEQGGQDATAYIMQINPKANSYANAAQLLNTINTKLIADERERKRRQAEYEKRQQIIDAENAKNKIELEKQRINAYRAIAVEYAKNQPTVIYRNVYHRIYWY